MVAASFLVTMLGTTLPTPLYPIYQQRLGFGGLTTTIVFAAYAGGVALTLLTLGRISDQIGRRRTLLPGLVISSLSAMVFLVDDRLGWGLAPLFVGRVLSGLSAGLFTGTATAYLVDLAPPEGRARASLLAAAVNMGGLGLGPPVAGVLAEYVPLPLSTPFIVDLAAITVCVAALRTAPETVDLTRPVRLKSPRPQVPASVRATFVRAAIAGFAGFNVLGLFTAVSPALLGQIIHEHNHAVVGVVVFALFASSTVGQLAASAFDEQRALVLGCAGLIVAMGAVALSLEEASLPLVVTGAVIAGLGQGMSFRAGLAAVNAGSPPEQRSEVASTYFLALYIGISIPVVGVGAAADAFGLVPAGVVFSIAVAVLAAVSLASLVVASRRSAVTA